MRDLDMAELYQSGASICVIANRSGHSSSTVSVNLRKLGIEMRAGGRPGGAVKPEPVSLLPPRYSCGHKVQAGYTQCPTCDRCQCPPKKQRRVAKYWGLWRCRCGRLIEAD